MKYFYSYRISHVESGLELIERKFAMDLKKKLFANPTGLWMSEKGAI